MPKFNKPKLNQPKVIKSQVNKSQSGDRPNHSKSLLSKSELPPVQLDETIVAGRRPKQPHDFQRLLTELSKLSSEFDDVEQFHPFLQNPPSFDFAEFERRISKILGDRDIEVSLEKLVKYFDYLKQNIQLPLHVTGNEDFPWEEEYVIGDGCQKEYARLKKTKPSYTDTFTIDKWDKSVIQENGIYVNVSRLGDRQKFVLPLEDLKAVDETSSNYQFLHDYVVWIVNFYE